MNSPDSVHLRFPNQSSSREQTSPSLRATPPHRTAYLPSEYSFLKNINVSISIGRAVTLISTILVFILLNFVYTSMNQVCPYNNDFDCYYRYLLCEDECGYEWPLYYTWGDFIVKHRKDEFMLATRLAGMIFKLIGISFVFSVMLYIGIFFKQLRFYIVVVLLNLFVLRSYRSGDEHGDYTKILGNWLFKLVFRFTVCFIVVTFLARLNSKNKAYGCTVFGSIILLVVSFFSGTAYRFFNSCNHWDKGLYGESIDNSQGCFFIKPNFCLFDFLGNIMDYNEWLMLTCEDRAPHWEFMDTKYPNASRIGFPILSHIPKHLRMFFNVQDYVSKNMERVNETNEKDFEVVLHRTKTKSSTGGDIYRGPAWLEINIRPNLTLIENRTKLVSESVANNVLVLSLDSMSRASAMRQLKETMKLLEETSPKVHQFFKYHGITYYTEGSMYPLFYGIKHPKPPLEKDPDAKENPSFINEYKNKGFITARALSLCTISTINTSFDWEYYHMIDDELFDHVGNGWACDVNARTEHMDESSTGPAAIVRRCAYGKDVSEYTLEYGKKFWEAYQDQKKFLWLDLQDFHDFTFSLGKYLDVHLSKFLKELDLKETLVIILGDHGLNIFKDRVWTSYLSAEIERAIPGLFVKLPASIESLYGENLEKNKQQFVHAYDLNRLLKAIPNPEQVKDTILYPLPERLGECENVVYEQLCYCPKEDPTLIKAKI